MVIFLTDGQATQGVTDPGDIIDNVRMNIDYNTHVYTLGFGFDLDYDFLERLAILTGGIATRVLPDTDATQQLVDFFRELNNPMLANIQFQFPDQIVDMSSIYTTSGIGSTNFIDPMQGMVYYEGSEITTAGKLLKPFDSRWSIHITANENSHKISPYEHITTVAPQSHSPVQMLEPYLPPGFTEKLYILSVFQEQYAASRVVKNKTESRQYEMAALSLALQYQLVTPLTSMIVTAPSNLGVNIEVQTTDMGSLEQSQYDTVLMSTVGQGVGHVRCVNAIYFLLLLCVSTSLFYQL